IAELKSKILQTNDAFKFDFDLLHANRLSAEDLKKSLIALPAIASKRLVVLRDIEKLSPQNKDLILEFIDKDESCIDLILDANQVDGRSAFMKKVTDKAKVVRFAVHEKANVFDMTKIMLRSPAEALKMLTQLLEEGSHPLQILGGLVWFWGKSRERLSPAQFKKGLLALQEADLNIKRSRTRPEHSLEILIVKLASLKSG
ncbi:MAG: hypothetical protein KC618_00780, partial [Candidatus Omnitrophica bacterium]|nr:hypothetical protein [Candidatus Omnitrophota bacterium]